MNNRDLLGKEKGAAQILHLIMEFVVVDIQIHSYSDIRE